MLLLHPAVTFRMSERVWLAVPNSYLVCTFYPLIRLTHFEPLDMF